MIYKNDPRRFSERLDGRMIFEDERAVANLSPKPINREWRTDHFDPKSEEGELLIKFFMGVK